MGLEGVMTIKAAGVSAFVIAAWASLAAAGPVADAAARAEALQADGDVVGALDALNDAVDAIWNDAPLSFRTIAVVNSASGFGVYEENAEPTFRPDQKLSVYVEPVGFGYGGGGTVGFSVDLSIENDAGQVLGEEDGVFNVSVPGPEGRREFYMTLTFEVPFLRPGAYSAVFTVHDENSDKAGDFTVPFQIALPIAE